MVLYLNRNPIFYPKADTISLFVRIHKQYKFCLYILLQVHFVTSIFDNLIVTHFLLLGKRFNYYYKTFPSVEIAVFPVKSIFLILLLLFFYYIILQKCVS